MIQRLTKTFLIIAVLVGAISASAAVVTSAKNSSWEQAKAITLANGPVVLFGTLGTTGDARFFRLDVSAPTTMNASLDVPLWADARFHPQVVVYQPDTVTASPGLPLIQPPDTIALVYPLTTKNRHFDRSTQTSMMERMKVDIELPVAGKYYLAVYNADQQSGRWRLELADQAVEEALPLTSWPKRWWLSQHWASSSFTAMYAPLVLLAVMIFVVWFLTRQRQPIHRQKKT